MGEMNWTRATIGGKIHPAAIKLLAETIRNEFRDMDYNADEFESVIADAIEDKHPLTFAGNVSYGNPEELLDFCNTYNLTVSVRSDAGSEWSAGGTFWEPGLTSAIEFAADNDGAPVMDLHEVRRHLNDGTLATHIDNLRRWGGGEGFPILERDETATQPDDDEDESDDEDKTDEVSSPVERIATLWAGIREIAKSLPEAERQAALDPIIEEASNIFNGEIE